MTQCQIHKQRRDGVNNSVPFPFRPSTGRMVTARNHEEILAAPNESIYALPGNNPVMFMPCAYDYKPSLELSPTEGKNWLRAVMRIVTGVMMIVATIFAPATVLINIAMVVGGIMMIGLGVNDIVHYATGKNYVATWFRMSQSSYEKLAHAIEIAALIISLVHAAYNILGPKCFAAGTLVLTADGNKKIEDVEVGDKVWAYDEETGENALKDVVRLS